MAPPPSVLRWRAAVALVLLLRSVCAAPESCDDWAAAAAAASPTALPPRIVVFGESHAGVARATALLELNFGAGSVLAGPYGPSRFPLNDSTALPRAAAALIDAPPEVGRAPRRRPTMLDECDSRGRRLRSGYPNTRGRALRERPPSERRGLHRSRSCSWCATS